MRVQAPVARSGSGPARCFPVFPKGPAPAAQRGIWHPSGLWPSVPRVVEKGCIASLRGPPIGGQDSDRVSHRCSAPYTLLPLRGISPQGETRDMREKNSESYTSGTISAFFPFGGWRHHLFPPHSVVGLWMLSRGAMSLQESIERPILPPA